MITIPRLQEFLFGLNLKTGSYIILSASLAITFFGLVVVTANRVEKDTTESDLDFQYIINMVASIIMFLTTPMALYGTYRERSTFLIPCLGVQGIGIIIIIVNLIVESIKLFEEGSASLSMVLFLLVAFATVTYSFLVIFSYFTMLKQQREEIQ